MHWRRESDRRRSIQGIGFALAEEQIMDRATGICVNPSYLDYKVLTTKDIPQIVSDNRGIVDSFGPFGQGGLASRLTVCPAGP